MTVPKLLRGLQHKHYACITADVPWKFIVRSPLGHGRSPEKHYDTMTLAEIAALPVADYAADDSFLLFWVTGPHLAIGSHLAIMRAWGFEPTGLWGVWIKPNNKRFKQGWMFFDDFAFFVGMGYTTRQNAEFVIVGKRGKPKRLSKSVRQVLASPRREHSRKPDEFFQRAEQFCAGPRLELFAREKREGWKCVGNEIDKFGAGDAEKVQPTRDPRSGEGRSDAQAGNGGVRLQPPDSAARAPRRQKRTRSRARKPRPRAA